jgi:hypothetical protein
VAVDTGVHIPSVSVPRISHQLQVLLGNIHDPQGNPQLGRRPLGFLGIEKRGLKGDCQEFNPLVLQQTCSQYAIQTARKETYSLDHLRLSFPQWDYAAEVSNTIEGRIEKIKQIGFFSAGSREKFDFSPLFLLHLNS